MNTAVSSYYHRADEWARSLPRGRYALLLGLSSGIGVLLVGLLVSQELFVVQALTMALVLFGLEYTFGRFQTPDE